MHLEYFQMIDRVVSVNQDATALTAQSVVPDQSPVFEGHFPGHPLVPGVLLIETMAQASGFMLMASNGFSAMPFLISVSSAKMRDFVEPNAVLDIEAEIDHDGSGFASTKARILSNGKRIANAELMLKTMPFPADALKTMILDRAKTVGMPASFMPSI